MKTKATEELFAEKTELQSQLAVAASAAEQAEIKTKIAAIDAVIVAQELSEIDLIKKKHGQPVIFKLAVDDKVAYYKKPDRQTLGYAMSLVQKDPLGFAEAILRGCFLEGDAELHEDVDYLMGVSGEIDQIVSIKTAEIKKY